MTAITKFVLGHKAPQEGHAQPDGGADDERA